jgi:hypothetical protein
MTTPFVHQAALEAAAIALENLNIFNQTYHTLASTSVEAYLSALPTKAEGWRPINESTPHDQWLWVWCPAYQDLSEMVCLCHWDEYAGFCVDELREPRMWRPVETPVSPEGGAP